MSLQLRQAHLRIGLLTEEVNRRSVAAFCSTQLMLVQWLFLLVGFLADRSALHFGLFSGGTCIAIIDMLLNWWACLPPQSPTDSAPGKAKA